MMKKEFQRIRDFYRASLSHYLFITAVAFVALLFISFVVGVICKDLSANIMEWFSQQVAQIGVADDEGNFSAIALFFNNTRAMTLSILFGLIPFAYFTALNLGTNSMLIGLFAAVFVNSGRSLGYYLMGILPHGVFEIPAMILSIACGIYLCEVVTENCRHKKEGAVKAAISNIFPIYFLIILPLVALAAITETYITPAVLQAIL